MSNFLSREYSCLCQEKTAVFKEYNIERHYSTKQASKFGMLNGQLGIDRTNSLKQNMIGQQSLFKAAKQSSEEDTKVSYSKERETII